MREFLKVLPLGLLLPLTLAAASVKPDDAISNIGAWARAFGFEHLSRWLANPAADNRVIAASMGIAAVYAFIMWTIPAIKAHRADPKSEELKIHLLTMGFYFCCAVLVIAVWQFMPGPQTPRESPRPAASPIPSSQIISRLDHFIFACDVPPPDSEAAARFPQAKEEMKQRFAIWGDVIGMSITVTDIRGGIRIDAEASTEEAKRRLFTAGTAGAAKTSISVRRIDSQIIVDVTSVLPPLYGMVPPDPSSQDTRTLQGKIENLVGALGKCRLL